MKLWKGCLSKALQRRQFSTGALRATGIGRDAVKIRSRSRQDADDSSISSIRPGFDRTSASLATIGGEGAAAYIMTGGSPSPAGDAGVGGAEPGDDVDLLTAAEQPPRGMYNGEVYMNKSTILGPVAAAGVGGAGALEYVLEFETGELIKDSIGARAAGLVGNNFNQGEDLLDGSGAIAGESLRAIVRGTSRCPKPKQD